MTSQVWEPQPGSTLAFGSYSSELFNSCSVKWMGRAAKTPSMSQNKPPSNPWHDRTSKRWKHSVINRIKERKAPFLCLLIRNTISEGGGNDCWRIYLSSSKVIFATCLFLFADELLLCIVADQGCSSQHPIMHYDSPHKELSGPTCHQCWDWETPASHIDFKKYYVCNRHYCYYSQP